MCLSTPRMPDPPTPVPPPPPTAKKITREPTRKKKGKGGPKMVGISSLKVPVPTVNI